MGQWLILNTTERSVYSLVCGRILLLHSEWSPPVLSRPLWQLARRRPDSDLPTPLNNDHDCAPHHHNHISEQEKTCFTASLITKKLSILSSDLSFGRFYRVIDWKFFRVIYNLYADRKLCAKVDGKLSEHFAYYGREKTFRISPVIFLNDFRSHIQGHNHCLTCVASSAAKQLSDDYSHCSTWMTPLRYPSRPLQCNRHGTQCTTIAGLWAHY